MLSSQMRTRLPSRGRNFTKSTIAGTRVIRAASSNTLRGECMSGIRSVSCGKLFTACYQRFSPTFFCGVAGCLTAVLLRQNRLRRERMQRLRLFTGDDHPFKHMLSPVPRNDSTAINFHCRMFICRAQVALRIYIAAHLQYVPKLKVMPDDEESLAEYPGSFSQRGGCCLCPRT